MPVVSVESERQPGGATIGALVFLGIGPFAQGGLDEAFGLAVGLWRAGSCADVPEVESLAGVAEGEGFVAGAVVGNPVAGP